ncbi:MULTISPECIES: hypothetical protein [unclassified Ensifer]|uniref:hypothetical protein n=1 Tax=unclassified Ensifer TaxID=2633371 RepID=UPI0008135761|nr:MULTISPECIES: hypothetical protein [unclassified Ensifer]OCP22437.1 hypothetical protein BC361_24600 [Ensifer sp. LC54]OCP22648.1 hypothetical protein BC363_26735 [Ensifer sp. LC384]
MAFFLQTFGGLRLLDEEGNDVAFPEKGLLILVYFLTIEKESAYRQSLAAFLWGHEDNAVSLTNLRKTVSRIRNRQEELGTQFLSFTETTISVDRASLSSDLLWVDKDELAEPLSRLMRLVELFQRSFLGRINCNSRDFEDWLAERRKRHKAILTVSLERAALLARTQAEYAVVKEAAILLFRAVPNDPDTLQLLVRIFHAEGEVEQLRQFFEERSKSISRGVDALPAGIDKDSAKVAAKVRPPSSDPAFAGPNSSFEVKETPSAAIPRLVLLPPSNQSSRPDAGLVAASLIEDITIGFCAFNSLQVIAPYSAVRIGQEMEDQVAFFDHHSVTYILDTRISSLGDEVTLFAQLIFHPNSEITWAERFSLGHLDLVRDRRVISRRIALSVSGEIERHEATRSYLELNPIAYHRYLIGKRHLNRLTLPDLRRARKEMKAALQASPDFAPALSAMARTYSKEWLLTARGDIDLLKTAETFSTRAINARPDLADSYREFGVAKLLQGAFDESAEALELAETLGPHYADVIADHADTLVHCSRPMLALQKIERAIELNPLGPDSYLWTAAGANYAMSQFEASLDYISQMADPSLADRLSAANWAMLDQMDKARFYVRRVRETNPVFDVDQWLSAVPSKEQWHKDLYRTGLKRAGF